ncbi:rod-binding protein [Persephonella sp.]
MNEIKIRPYWDIKDLSQIKSKEEIAKEFEAIFVRMLMKEFRKSIPEGLFSSSFSSNMYWDMFDMQISEAIASADQLGIKSYILQALESYEKYSSED